MTGVSECSQQRGNLKDDRYSLTTMVTCHCFIQGLSSLHDR
ncbi:hypothetical protein [Photorhabdus bodei]|nr:hypothetical protein [Photorhabdus bodei]